MRTILLVRVFLVFCVMTAAEVRLAYGQLLDLATGLTTGAVVDQLTGGVDTMIGRAESAGDFVLARAGQEARYVLDAYKAANRDLLDQAFDGIARERAALLNDLNETLGRLSTRADLTLEAARSMLDQFHGTVALATLNSYPFVFRSGGTIVVPGVSGDVRVVFNGANIVDEAPLLTIGKAMFKVRRESVQTLVAEIPRGLFEHHATDLRTQLGTLEIKHRGFWGDETVTYSVAFTVLPIQVATAGLSYTANITEQKEDPPFRAEVNHNSSSRSWNCQPYTYSPKTAERRFDLARSAVTPHSGNSRGELRNVSVRDVGISFKLCARRGITDRDNGFRHAFVDYVEVWTETRQEQVTLDPIALKWTEPMVLRLPEGASGELVTVAAFGQPPTVRADTGDAGQFVHVQFKPADGLILLQPVVPLSLR